MAIFSKFKCEVKQTAEGRWGVYVNGSLFGDAKQRFDADHAAKLLTTAVDDVALEVVMKVMGQW
jgi:hypothetical protein